MRHGTWINLVIVLGLVVSAASILPASGPLIWTTQAQTPLTPNLLNGADRFVGVAVEPLAEMLPRQRFASVDITVQAPTPSSAVIYVSPTSGGEVDRIDFRDEDILAYDVSTGDWSMYFDGSDVYLGSSGLNLNAFHIEASGSILLSLVTTATIPGVGSIAATIPNVGSIAENDIVRFIPTSTGDITAGTFEWYFDGSDVGLTTSGEDIDAIGFAPDGRLVISTSGTFYVRGINGVDEDLILFTATSLGQDTSGSWQMYFDGSDVGLDTSRDEDVAGTWIDNNGDIYLTTMGTFSVPDVTGDGADIFTCVPGMTGYKTSCTYSLFWDGSAHGFGDQVINAFFLSGDSNHPPVANDDVASTSEDTAVDITLTASDPDGDPVTYSVVTGPSHGTLSGTPPDVTYTPDADYYGADSFTFRANDGTDDSNLATVSITVNAVNDPPEAVDDSGTTDEDTAVIIDVLANDSDVDGDTLTVDAVTQPLHGSVTNNGSDVTYTPDADYCGGDSFTYTADDGNGGSDTATVTVSVTCVNDPPEAVDDSGTTDEDTTVIVDVLANDNDVDGDTLTVDAVTQPLHGSVTNNGSDVTYTPDADYCGADSFTYTAGDGNGGSDTATVTMSVTCVNDPPVADDQAVITPEDTPKDITLTASDVDGDPLTFSIVTGPTHGTLSGTPPNVAYTPDGGYNGPDSFTFVANDGWVDSNEATVSITVGRENDPPEADDQLVSTDEDMAVDITLTASDPDGDPLTYSVVTGPSHGTLSGTPPNVTYTPTLNYNGADSFTFKANDGMTVSNRATVSITVTPVNDPPTISDCPDQTTTVDTRVRLTFTISDVDTPVSQLTLAAASSDTVLVPLANILVSGSGGDRFLTVTPSANLTGTATITLTVSDGQATASDAFKLTVNEHVLYLPLVLKNEQVRHDIYLPLVLNNAQLRHDVYLPLVLK